MLALLAVVVLPIGASAMSTGPGGDTSWHWSNPLPQGNDALAQSWVSSTTGWMAGRNGLLLKTTDGGVSWVYQDPGITSDQQATVDIRGIAFADANTGWLGAGNALVKRTTDGGSTWTTTTALPADFAGYAVNTVAAYGTTGVIAAGAGGRLAYSADGGTTWGTPGTNPARTAGVAINAVHWQGANTAYAVTASGLILRTTDGGATWATQYTGTLALNSISFGSGTTVGYAVGVNGTGWTVLRTTNGTTWAAVASQENVALYGVSVLDANNCVLVGARGACYKTANASAGTPTWTSVMVGQMRDAELTGRAVRMISATRVATVGDSGISANSSDGGVSWTTARATVRGGMNATWFTDANNGWMCGANGVVRRTTDGGTTWTNQQVGTGTWRGIYFLNATTGWMVGDAGATARTTNGGTSWTTGTAGTNRLNAVRFYNATNGFAVGAGGYCYQTANGGTSWTSRTTGTTNELYGVYPVGTQNAYMVGAGGVVRRVYYTVFWWANAGATTPGGTANLYAMAAASATEYWAVGSGGTVWRSTNSGANWAAVTSGTTTDLYSASFFSSSAGLVGGANGTVRLWNGTAFSAATNTGLPAGSTMIVRGLSYPAAAAQYLVPESGIFRRSTDAGANWLSSEAGIYERLNAVSFVDSTHGWMVGDTGRIYVTSDGNTWSPQLSRTASNLYGVSFGSSTVGYAVGAAGAISRTTNGGSTWTPSTAGASQFNAVASSRANPNYAIAVGVGGTIRFTTDGGVNWNAATSLPGGSTGDNMLAVSYVSTSSTEIACVAVGHTAGDGSPTILRTTDHGQTWTAVGSFAQPASGVSFAPAPYSAYGWASGASGAIYRTTDSGASWTSQTTPVTVALSAVSAATSQSAFAVGAAGNIVQTADGGTTWLTQNSGFGSSISTQTLTGVVFTSPSTGFVVGSSGVVLRATNEAPPNTTATLLPATPDGSNGWYRSATPTATLTPDQAARTYYRWGTGPWTQYSTPVKAAEGVQTLYYYSVNAFNRTEPVRSVVVNSDLTPPSQPGNLVATPSGDSVQIQWGTSSLDTGSGLARYELWYRIGAGAAQQAATTDQFATSAIAFDLASNTTYTFWVVAYDNAGNSSSSTTIDATTDALGPLTTSASAAPPSGNGANGWYTMAPTITLTATPTVPTYTHYSWDGSTWSTYTAPFTMTPQGPQTLYYWSEDTAGLRVQEIPKSTSYSLDLSSPNPGTCSVSGATTSSLDVTWSGASDLESQIEYYVVWVGGTPSPHIEGTSYTCPDLQPDQEYQVYVQAFNYAGLQSVTPIIYPRTAANPPVYTVPSVTPGSPDGSNGWYRTIPSVSLVPMPVGLSTAIRYWWNSSAPATYTAPTSPTQEGPNQLRFWTVDLTDSDNRENTQTLDFNVDTGDPAIPLDLTAQSLSTSSIGLTWSAASDAVSGVDRYRVYMGASSIATVTTTSYQVDGLPPNAVRTFYVVALDAAGNESGLSTPANGSTLSGDTMTTTADPVPSLPDGLNGWYTTAPDITLSASPSTVTAETYYTWGSPSLTLYSGPLTAPNGVSTLSFWSIDAAHERAQETTKTRTYQVDTTNPTAPSGVAATGASTTSLNVTWSAAADAESTIDRYEVYVEGSLATTVSSSLQAATVGGLAPATAYSVYVRAVNRAGRTTNSTTVSGTTQSAVTVYTLTTVTPLAANGNNGWYTVVPTISLATTPTSIAASTHYCWDPPGAGAVYSAALSAPEGTHRLEYHSEALADSTNRDATQTLDFNVDTGDPAIPLDLTAQSLSTSSIGLTWSAASDAVSGVDRYRVYMGASSIATVTTTSYQVDGLPPNAVRTFYVVALDAAGNESGLSTPANGSTLAEGELLTSASPSPATPNGLNDWYTTAPDITLSASPSTVTAETYYTWGSPSLTLYSGPLTAPNGVSTLSFWSIDAAHERAQETTKTRTYQVDTTNPTAPSGVAATGASTTSLNISWGAAADGESGIWRYNVYVGSNLATTVTGLSATVGGLAVNRSFEVFVTSENRAGLVATSTVVNGSTLENGAILTERVVTPTSPNGLNGWYQSTPTISLSTTPTSVLASTYYCWDPPGALTTYTATLSASEGVHRLEYHSVDTQDDTNTDATQTADFRVDITDPSPPAGLTAESAGSSAIRVYWPVGADAVSGVDHYNVYMDSLGVPVAQVTATETVVSSLVPNRIHTFWVTTVDVAGHESATSVSALGATLAEGALQTTADPSPTTPNGLNGWYTTVPQITLSSTPSTVSAYHYYAWGGEALTTYTAQFAARTGTNQLSFWSIDVDNTRAREVTKTSVFNVDTTSPTVPASVAATGASTTSLLVSWSASADDESAIDHYGVYVDGTLRASVSSATLSTTVGGLAVNRTFPVFVTAVNRAGLVATSTVVSGSTIANPRVETTATVTPGSPDGANDWYQTMPTVSLVTSPAALPVWTYYCWDPPTALLATYTGTFTPPTQGVHVLGFHSVDQVDDTNRDDTSTVTLRWDSIDPSPPTSVYAAAVTTSTIAVEWTAGADTSPGSGVHHYVLYRNNVPQPGSIVTTGTILSGLKPNSIYEFYVVAFDTAGNESARSTSTFIATTALDPLQTTATVSPANPDGLSSWYVTTPSVSFTVTPNVAAWTYYSWNGSALATAFGPVMPSSDGTNTLQYWSVDQALDHANEETKALAFRMDTWPDVRPSPEASPTMEATATLVTDSLINIEWTPPPSSASGVDHYEVRTDWGPVLTTARSYMATDLEPITKYPFKVYAINVAGTYYAQTATLTVETSAPPLPYAPPSVLAVAPSGNFVNVNWGVSRIAIGELGYHVWRSTDAQNYSQIATVTGQWNLTYTDPGLRSSTRYWYAVTAFDDRGESSFSDSSTAVWPYTAPTTGRPERVSGLSATEGSGTVLLTWAPAANPAVTGYRITRSGQSMTSETTITPVAVPATMTPSYLDTTPLNGQTYYYRVYPIDTSSTVGFGSLEIEAKPRTVLSTATIDPHVLDNRPSGSCSQCHKSHAAPSLLMQYRYDSGGNNEVVTCIYCHSPNSDLASKDTSSEVMSGLNRSSVDMWLPESQSSSMTCIDCHRTLASEDETTTAGLLTAGGTLMMRESVPHTGSAVCYECHGSGSTLLYGDMTAFDDSAHATTDVPDPASGSKVKCQACHESHASRNTHLTRYEGVMQCAQCHSTPTANPNQADMWSRLTLGTELTSSHALLPEDMLDGSRLMCQNCHSTHASTETTPVVDPHNPSPAGMWAGNLNGSTMDYCFRCHDGQTLPTNVQTAPYAGAVLGRSGVSTTTDIASAYTTNVHGLGVSSNVTTTTALLRTDMGYVANSALDCTACHDTHGSYNAFTLKTLVPSQNGETSVAGAMVYKIPAGSITATSPVGYDFRFMCSTCHKFDPKTHDPIAGVGVDTRQFGKTDCASCHKHRLANGTTSGL